MPYDPTYHLLGRVDKIRAIVNAERPDVLEIHSPYLAMASGLLAGRKAVGIRTFFWHADFIDTYFRPFLEARVAPRVTDTLLAPIWEIVRALANACDATLVAGKLQAEKLRAHGVERVVHIPFGIEKSFFHAGARSESRRQELLGARHASSPSTRVLVGVGRFAAEKRWDVVLDAFVQLRDAGAIDAVLVLFGDGPERAAMEARVRGRDDVTFMGFEKDRAALAGALASADVLVHGCPYETFGLGVAEAMSAGLAVVVPDLGGASESVDTRSGAIYRSGDAGACARALAKILARDPEELRHAALASAETIGDVKDHFVDLLEIYRDLLA